MGHITAIPAFRELISLNTLHSSPLGSLQPLGAKRQFVSAAQPAISLARLGAPPLLKLFLAPRLQLKVAAATPPKTAAAEVLDTISLIEKKLKTTVYNPNTKVDIAKGIFEFDCSGMVNWILERNAPKALEELKSARPRVIEYVKALKAIPANQPSQGWRRVAKIADAEPGDVIAWPTPDWYPSHATGHMGILVAKPEAVDGGYLLRIADSTSYPHGDDSREGGTGFGYGTILVTVDSKTGAGTGQGWTGRHSYNTVIETPIYVGRPLQ